MNMHEYMCVYVHIYEYNTNDLSNGLSLICFFISKARKKIVSTCANPINPYYNLAKDHFFEDAP